MPRIRPQHVCLLTLGLALAGCNTPVALRSSDSSQSAQPAFTTAAAKRQDVIGYSFFDGKLVIPSTAQAVAFSPYDTSIEAVPAGVGTYVKRGQEVVKLTIPGADAAADVAKENVSSAKSALSSQKADVSEPVRQARKQLDDARAAEKEARDTVANGGTADVDSATQARVDAENSLRQAQDQADQALRPAKSMVAQSAAELAAIRADARKGIVRSPIAGTIIVQNAKTGAQAAANESLATIVNFEDTRVQGVVPPELKDQVVEDTPVIVTMAGASSAPIDARVTKVTVVAPSEGQPSPGYLAEIRFDKPREMLQPSTIVRKIGVKTGEAKDVVVVPLAAVSSVNGKNVVKIQKGNDWVETNVETGLSDGVVIEIKSGLNEGDVVQVPAGSTAKANP